MKAKLTQSQFISNAQAVHGDIYDYSQTIYNDARTNVAIICREHGLFIQNPHNHTRGSGCPKCRSKLMAKLLTISPDEFIQNAQKVHGNKYSYDKINFVNTRTKIEIVCPEHGSFWQQPTSHLSNRGCPKCQTSKGEDAIRNYLIDNNIPFAEQYRHPDCKDIKMLPFDFYLPSYNLLIEFQGRQHFQFIKRWHKTLEYFEQSQNRDKIKKEWATKTMNYLEINYQDNITEILIVNLL